jgi:hypothetical protein
MPTTRYQHKQLTIDTHNIGDINKDERSTKRKKYGVPSAKTGTPPLPLPRPLPAVSETSISVTNRRNANKLSD